jgi:hypothetical protein
MKETNNKKIIEVIVIILFIVIIFISKLFQNIAAEPFSFEKMFSLENIKETLFILGIICGVSLPIYLLVKKYNSK